VKRNRRLQLLRSLKMNVGKLMLPHMPSRRARTIYLYPNM